MLMTIHCVHNMNVVKGKLYRNFDILDTCFYDKYIALSPGKWNFLCLGLNLSLDGIFVCKRLKLKILA